MRITTPIVLMVVAACAVNAAGAWSGGQRATTAAPAELLRDPTARLFTLLHRLGEGAAVGVMPNGDVLVASDTDSEEERAALWRLGVDGRYEQISSLPGAVSDLVGETPTTLLMIPANTRRVERYDLTTERSTVVADLSSPSALDLEQLVVLDDGSVVVTDGDVTWRVRSEGVTQVPGVRKGAVPGSLAALPGGAFAYVDVHQHALVRVGAEGQRRMLLRFPPYEGSGTVASNGDQLVVLRTISPTVWEPRMQMTSIRAGRIRDVVTQRMDPPVYGNGDGYGGVGLPTRIGWAWLARDGSLLVRQYNGFESSLRALVPGNSRRLRIALRPAFWRSFARGSIDYWASTAGTLDLVVRARGRTVTKQRRSTRAGARTLRLRRTLPRGRYYVRLTFTTSMGTRTRATARVVTNTTLSLREARTALGKRFDNDEGDGGGGGGTEIGKRCVRRSRTRIDCRLEEYEYSDEESVRVTCRGWTVAQLRPDGVHTRTSDLHCPPIYPP